MTDATITQETTIPTRSDEILELGTWLGRKQAFAELAGRCSAADAECLRRVRSRKMYRALKLSWREFCKQRLGISGSTADLIIQRLEEFGPQYFILAQATGITAEQYRSISGSVRGQMLLHAGEEIPITAENAPRLAAAVEELRREAAPVRIQAGPADLGTALDKVDRMLAAAVDEISRLHELPLESAERGRLQRTVIAHLHRIPLFQLAELRRVR